MNRRIAKKKYKNALYAMRHPAPEIAAVMIINQAYVDKKGRECDPMQGETRFITLKRPKIQYIKKRCC